MNRAEESNLLDLLESAGRPDPNAPAVLSTDGALTHAQLCAGATKLGHALAAATDRPAVALFLPMHPSYVTAFFGTLYAGKAVLPMNMLLPPQELAFILQDSGADLLLTLKPFKSKLEKLPVKVLAMEELGAPERPVAPRRPRPDDLCTLLYTSGTTGRPKGVELTHRNLASNCLACIETMGLTRECRALACLPTFHTFAVTATILAPLLAGGSVFTLPKFDPDRVLKSISEAQCNVLVMVPSMFRLVTRRQERRPRPLEHLKLAVAGGEALPDEVRAAFEKVFGIPLLEGYGQTEASPVICFNTAERNKPGTVGRPLPNVQVRIVDPEALTDRAGGQVGEVWVKGPNVMRGYRNRPEETAQALTGDGWLRTGDMGCVDEEGYLKLTGRLREMVKVGGEMVFPAEVENVLLDHPAVHEAGVVGQKHERRGETVQAFVALKEEGRATEEELLAHCRKSLAGYKVPRSIEFRAELPKGPTGKVLRRFLK